MTVRTRNALCKAGEILESSQGITEYYDSFGPRFKSDLARGNPRVELQLRFVKEAIGYHRPNSILLVGCGWGQAAWSVAKGRGVSRVVAMEHKLIQHRNGVAALSPAKIHYVYADIRTFVSGQTFDIVVLPDVYEHIPLEDRSLLHEAMRSLIGLDGVVAMTFASEWHQRALQKLGERL